MIRLSSLRPALSAFVICLAISFMLRILYAGHLYEDDGLWFTAAEEILRGKALYREIYFDKPPVIALLYAALFKVFGAHIIVVRLFSILYAGAVSLTLYWFGEKLYDRRIGLLAGVMFAVFSTTHATGHMQGLNTDFLMAGPYTLAALLFVTSLPGAQASRLHHTEPEQHRTPSGVTPALPATIVAGIASGVAFQINFKAVFALAFFGLLLSLTRGPKKLRAWSSAGVAIVGFALGSLPCLAYIAMTGGLHDYWLYVWHWGARYAGYLPLGRSIANGFMLTASYFSLNNTLLVALIFLTASALRNRERNDMILLLWAAVSFLGVAMGGRFYAHYFFSLLPALCLIGGRGLSVMRDALSRVSPLARRTAMAAMLLGFAFTFARFHGRTAFLALDQLSGEKSEATGNWRSEMLNREERMVAAVVRGMPKGAEAADRVALEAIRAGGPRETGGMESKDYLFVWGYRPEIYFWSGLLPASRFLSTQPLTGVPADVHYINGERQAIIDESLTARARAELVRELTGAQPEYIIDELGFFNSALDIQRYPELLEFISGYKKLGATGRFFIYRRRGS